MPVARRVVGCRVEATPVVRIRHAFWKIAAQPRPGSLHFKRIDDGLHGAGDPGMTSVRDAPAHDQAFRHYAEWKP